MGKKLYGIFNSPFDGYVPTGGGGFAPVGSAEASTSQSLIAQVGWERPRKTTLQSQHPIIRAYLEGGGDWAGHNAINRAVQSALHEIENAQRAAEDACDRMVAHEEAYKKEYGNLVRVLAAGDLQKMGDRERRRLDSLQGDVDRSFQEVLRANEVRLERRPVAAVGEELVDWLRGQRSGSDPDKWVREWAHHRKSVANDYERKARIADRQREEAEKKLEVVEHKLWTPDTPKYDKSRLKADAIKATNLRIEAIDHQVYGSIAEKLKKEEFRLTV